MQHLFTPPARHAGCGTAKRRHCSADFDGTEADHWTGPMKPYRKPCRAAQILATRLRQRSPDRDQPRRCRMWGDSVSSRAPIVGSHGAEEIVLDTALPMLGPDTLDLRDLRVRGAIPGEQRVSGLDKVLHRAAYRLAQR